MRITKDSLQYFNKKGIELIYDKIRLGLDESIKELIDGDDEDLLAESFQITLKDLEAGHRNKREAVLAALKDLELSEYQDYFWNDGWEETFGLDSI